MGQLITVRRSVLSSRDIQLKRDRGLQQNLQKLKDCKKDFENLNNWLMDVLDLPVNRPKQMLARTIQSIVPRMFFDFAPTTLTRWIAEETNPIDFIITHLRTNVMNVQEIVKNLKNSAETEMNLLTEFVSDINQARDEKWDPRRLQDYVAEKSELTIYPEVQELLDEKFNLFTPEELEKRRFELLNRLEGNAIARKQVVEAHAKVCGLALDVFLTGAYQYMDVITIIEPLRVIHEATEGMLDMNTSVYAAKEIVIQMVQLDMAAIEQITEATKRVNDFSIASPDIVNLFEDANKKIDGHIKAIEAAREKAIAFHQDQRKLLGFSTQEKERGLP